MDLSSTRIAWTLQCSSSATRCIATPSSALWRNSSASAERKLRPTTSSAPAPSLRQIGKEISKEINDEHDREEVSKSRAHERAHQGSAPVDARAACRETRP